MGFNVTVVNSTAVTASWSTPERPNGIVLFYTLTYTLVGGNSSVRTVPHTDGTAAFSVELGGLLEFTLYAVSVSAATRIGEGNSVTRMIRTDTDRASPPRNTVATALNSSFIMLYWEYPETPRGNIRGYVITSNATNEPINVTLEEVDDMTSQVTAIGNLQAYTTYSFEIAAFSFSFLRGFTEFNGETADATATTLEDGMFKAYRNLPLLCVKAHCCYPNDTIS